MYKREHPHKTKDGALVCQIGIRADVELSELADKLARKLKLSKNEVLRRALRVGLEQVGR